MKSSSAPQSATSLPRAPRDEAQSRQRKYFLMMSVRVVCFVAMVAITPYGWYTVVLAIGAVLLPYLAVVIANVSSNVSGPGVVSPERQLPPARSTPAVPSTDSQVIRVHEAEPNADADHDAP